MKPAAGFTLIELIVVMMLMAILAAVALPRFFGRGDFEGPAFAEELASAARYAQKLAVTTGCPVRLVIVGSTRYELKQPAAEPAGATCDTTFSRDVLNPATGTAFAADTPPGVAIGNAGLTVEFSAAGVPNAPASIAVGGRTVVITARSGYVDVQ